MHRETAVEDVNHLIDSKSDIKVKEIDYEFMNTDEIWIICGAVLGSPRLNCSLGRLNLLGSTAAVLPFAPG